MSWKDYPIIEGVTNWQNYPVVSEEETDAERETRLLLEYARRRIAGSPIPNLVAAGAGLAASIAGPVQRITGFRKKAASTARIARAFEQAAEEEAQRPEKILPPIIARGLRGTLATLPTQVIAGAMGGPAGAIGLAAIQEGNQAIFEGREAGLSGVELAKYATTQATVEAVPAMVMQRLGLGGFEGIFGKATNQRITSGVVGGLKRAGIQTLQEIPEEIITELGHNVAAAVTDVDPGAIGLERMGETVANTVVGTLMQMGVATAPGVARAALTKEEVLQPGAAPGEAPVAPSRAEWLTRYKEELLAAKEPTAAPEAAPAEALPEDNEVALNKIKGAEIRETLNLPELSEDAVQTFDVVMNDVAESKADEKALSVADEILTRPREISSHEHAAMVLKATKLMDELDVSEGEQAAAAEAGDQVAYGQAIARDTATIGQLDKLTEASRYARREVARTMSIGRLRLSREKYDVVDVLQKMQVAKGPEGKLTDEERSTVARLTKEHTALTEQIAQMEEEARIREESREEEIALKVLAVNKPRGTIGRKIREKAVTEREDIKKRIRQMGLRVNDITSIPVEGTYLIGRLGLTYVKEGAGTLVEVMERLRADMPDLDLTQYDVNKALIQRNPKWKVQARSEAQKRKAKLLSLARMEVELEDIANEVAVKAERRESVDADVRDLRKKLGATRAEYYKSDIDAARIERAIATVNRLQDQLDNGLTILKKEPEAIPPELAAIGEQVRQLRMELRVNEELAAVDEQLKTGEVFPSPKKEKKPVNPRLERKQIELARKRREIQQMVADAVPWGAKRAGREIAHSLKALKATADLSFTFRQNIWQVFSHPIRTSKAFVPAWRAFLNEYSAEQIHNSLLNSGNAFLYEQSGLAILDATSIDARQRSEVFRGRVIEKVPVLGQLMKASSRHAVTIGNLVRTSAFDQFIANNPDVTQAEMRAFADYANVSTGLGNLGKFGAIGKELELVFFAPRFAVSRIQTPYVLLKHWKQPRVRKQIARDMVGFISTGGMVLTLAAMAGADVEWLDPDSPDWMKIRIGDMRIDIFGGFQQPARVIARIGMGALGREVGVSPLEILGRFAAFKFAPAVTIPLELLRGRTAVGEEVTPAETAARAVVPLVFEDIYEAWKLEGALEAGVAAALAIPGIGVSTYRDSETVTRKKIKKLKRAHKYTEAEQLRLDFNQREPENRIVTVKVD